ncbi:MAG: PadR family transcriptional regulator [Thermoplasmata archaeon]|nr:PadR family transcriptional regulator [Thermoplasmata archaeon]
MHGWKGHRRRGLRTWVLSLLSRAPKNGAEIMDSIEEMSQGWWRPSPGSIYPLLDGLQQEGVIRKRPDGRYEVTEQAKDELEWPFGMGRPARTVEDMVKEMNGYVSYFEDLRRSEAAQVDAHKDAIRKLAERLSALTRNGGASA